MGIGALSPRPLGQRIAVVGTSGSGKSTFAARLARVRNVPHIELDALHWLPNWEEEDAERFRAAVSAAVSGDSWVVDGNYSVVRDLVWGRANTVIWLDLPLIFTLQRLVRRTAQRIVCRTTLWNGNRETVRNLFEVDNVIVWSIKTHFRHRKQYPELLSQYGHLDFLHLSSAPQAEAVLRAIESARALTL